MRVVGQRVVNLLDFTAVDVKWMAKQANVNIVVVPLFDCWYASANNTGTMAATGTTSHAATLVNPIGVLSDFHGHYSGQSVPLNRNCRGTTTVYGRLSCLLVSRSKIGRSTTIYDGNTISRVDSHGSLEII